MNNKLDVEKKILGIFESILEAEQGSVTLSQTFDELRIDSILFIRLVVQCETEFNVQFEDEMLLVTKFPDVDTFAKYIIGRC